METTQFYDFDDSKGFKKSELTDDEPAPAPLSLGLFWRTFLLLSALILVSMFTWLQTIKAMESEARDIESARNLASVVNLSQAALNHLDAISRIALIRVMAEEEGLHIYPRKSSDHYELMNSDSMDFKIASELRRHLGNATVVANQVNGKPGLWVGFAMDADNYWLLAEHKEWALQDRTAWLLWLALPALFSLAGAALIARLVNRPLKELLFAASRVQEGRFEASRLNEQVPTHEIRDVNIGFNRMAQRLSQAEQDRVVMLAGISHDLRTPLARLRLECEMSVPNQEARDHMVADIEQLDAIVDKFLDYARPQRDALVSVDLRKAVDTSVYAFSSRLDLKVSVRMQDGLSVKADAVELGRVISNIIENACRYGKSVDTGMTEIEIAAIRQDQWVLLKIRDHGVGVEPRQLSNLLQPFYRGEAARTAAKGAGLGLAIVDKTVRRMGGTFALSNASSGGLSANIRLLAA